MLIWLPSGDRDGLFGKLIKPLTCEVRKAISTLPLSVSGQPFVKRFALCYGSVVCLSVLSVTFVHCGQTAGRIQMKHGMQVGLGPGHIVLGGGTQLPLP